ncbi:phosphoglycolate phosphatase [Flavobacterium flevense]|uniref:phosphoglycolate phosphatase n=1 Tax=Flavobacterium flevense TaxID=983 RepID=A0A4Y4AV68_9FLAO|nr:HAD-IA family hydrolase [Flavobacterium flevense]GEC72121.1 phosphoglycolate phosphatase [Flavobacterium flevense]SHL94448.1 phosphoglycolate phosphatase [Flavobacterium flevense]
MKFKAVLFDLDGTLVNSLIDIADSINKVLQGNQLPTHSYEVINNFIGSGLRVLVTKALPETHRNEENIEKHFQAMMLNYRDNCTNKTIVYDGITELLEQLKSRNIKMAILSNKADELTKKIGLTLFPDYFEIVMGLKSEATKKPNPAAAIEISNDLGFSVEEILYVGDSDIDMQTARNANMYAVGVTWGYRPKEELLAEGAQSIINHPLDLLELL